MGAFPYLQVGEAILLTRHGNQAIGVQGFAREIRFTQDMYAQPYWGRDWGLPTEFEVNVDISMLALRTVMVDLIDIADIWTPQSPLPQPRLTDGGTDG